MLAPYAGGSAFAFAEWIPRLVAADEAAVVLRYPVVDPTGAGPGLGALADAAAAAVLAVVDGPLVLVGHSLGGLVAYELALRLEPVRPVHLLVVSAARPPGHARMTEDQVLAMTDDQWRDEVLAQGLIDEESAATPGMLDVVVPTLRANYLLLARNPPPTGRVSCPLLVLGGTEDAGVPPELLGLWGDRTTARSARRMYSGGHFYYREQLPDVCREIRDAADRKAERSY